MTTKRFLLALLLILALVSCTRSGAANPIGVSTSTPEPSPSASIEGSITYQRSGGIAGTDDTWTIDPQGKVTHQGSDSVGQLTGEEIAALTSAMRAAHFTTLADSYVGTNPCCDRFTYTITLVVNGQSKTVRTIDASPTAPPELTHLADTLNQIVSSATSGS